MVGAFDGDTITVLDRGNVQHRIRLSDIDAPEKGQAFGDRSKESLSRLLFDRYRGAATTNDRYDPEVCDVMRASRLGGIGISSETLTLHYIDCLRVLLIHCFN